MIVPTDRRGFLCGLVTLPLIGGAVTLIGNPTAAAIPVTDALRDRYIAWLQTELGHALIERTGRNAPSEHADRVIDWRREWCRNNPILNPDTASDRFTLLPLAPASSRAAVVLSAAGVPITGTGL